MKDNFIDKQVQYWDTLARSVPDSVALNHWIDENNNPLDAELFYEIAHYLCTEFLQNKASGNILEIGCGNGLILNNLKCLLRDNNAWNLFGADISTEMLERNTDKKVTLYQCDASRIPCGDHLFDLVYMHSVVQYFDNESYLDAVLKECLRIVRDGGAYA